MKRSILASVLSALTMVGWQQNDFELVKSEHTPFLAETEVYGDDAESRTLLDA